MATKTPITITTTLTGGEKGDTYTVFDLPTLRSHVASGHPTDTADMLLYFFLRDFLEGDTPDGNPGTTYSLFKGRKKLVDGKVRGVPAVLLALDGKGALA